MFKFIDFFNSATLKTSYNYYFPEFTLISCEIIFLMYFRNAECNRNSTYLEFRQTLQPQFEILIINNTTTTFALYKVFGFLQT